MSDLVDIISETSRVSATKIILVVIDGLGGLPNPATGKTELETANTLELDRLAAKGVCGLIDPVAPGITPGSAPGHAGLFGYDPVDLNMGRGVLEAMGIGFDLEADDIAARGNFCTIDEAGIVTDRRAGRMSTERCAELCRMLDGMVIDGVKTIVLPVREHRFMVVFRGEGLAAEASDSDPQQTGVRPVEVKALNPQASRLAGIANQFVAQSVERLAGHHPANMALLRGFSKRPHLSSMSEVYKLKPAAIAGYPMYRGLARLAGMEVLEAGNSVEDELSALERSYDDHDFFFLHVKGADTAGEDGDFDRKVRVIEEIDGALSRLVKLEPDVIVVTGDHSTPALLGGHSWHPVPVLLCSKWCRPDRVTEFSESACITGGLGRLRAQHIMALAMANALKLTKYGP